MQLTDNDYRQILFVLHLRFAALKQQSDDTTLARERRLVAYSEAARCAELIWAVQQAQEQALCAEGVV